MLLFDLLVAVLASCLRLALDAAGVPHVIVAAIATAASFVWPGYLLSLLIVPDARALTRGRRLAIVPPLSLLVVTAVAVAIWLSRTTVSTARVNDGVLLVTAVLAGGIAAQRLARHHSVTSREHDSLLDALVVFGIAAAFMVPLAFGPATGEAITHETPMTFIDATGTLCDDPVSDRHRVVDGGLHHATHGSRAG